METKVKERSSAGHKILSVIGILLCVVLVPVLIINVTLIIKGYTNKDEVPSIGGYAPMIVLTNSMEGTFDGGDLIFVKTADAEDIKKGDIITYFDPEGSGTAAVTHRVLEVVELDGKIYFNTKGDANPSADKVSVPEEKLIGVYANVRIPNAGHVAMFMQTTWGLVVCVLLPIILLIGYDAIRRNRYNKKHANDKDELLAELEALRAQQNTAEENTNESEELRVESGVEEATTKADD